MEEKTPESRKHRGTSRHSRIFVSFIARKYKVHGWLWSWWAVSNVERLNLNVMTLKPTCESVETAKGVPLTLTGVAQVRIMYTKGQKAMRACNLKERTKPRKLRHENVCAKLLAGGGSQSRSRMRTLHRASYSEFRILKS